MILVTGGSGVLGFHVARALAADGKEVLSISTSGAPPHAELGLGELRTKITFVAGDITSFDELRAKTSALWIEGVIHTAALTGEKQARSRPLDVIQANIVGTANVLELGRQLKVGRIVLVGSSSEYGRREDLQPIREDEEQIQGLYAETKYAGHRLGDRYREVFGLDVISTRVTSVYGPYARFNEYRGLVGNTLMAYLTRAASRGEKVRLEGGGDYPRGWTYAADTARGVCLAYSAERPKHTMYNIASNSLYTVSQVVEALKRVVPDADIAVGPGTWDADPFQAGNLRGPLDTTRAAEELGFLPEYGLDEGLRAYVEWWRQAAEQPA